LDGASEAARHADSLSNEIGGLPPHPPQIDTTRSRRTLSVRCGHPLRAVVLVLKFRFAGNCARRNKFLANFIHAACTDIAEIQISPVTARTNALLSTAATRITNGL
jgi:hypothetical protein